MKVVFVHLDLGIGETKGNLICHWVLGTAAVRSKLLLLLCTAVELFVLGPEAADCSSTVVLSVDVVGAFQRSFSLSTGFACRGVVGTRNHDTTAKHTSFQLARVLRVSQCSRLFLLVDPGGHAESLKSNRNTAAASNL